MPLPRRFISVLPRRDAKVQNYAALMGGGRTNAFHGFEANREIGAPFVHPETNEHLRHLVHIKKLGAEHAIHIGLDDPYIGEYRRALRDHDLWPADEFTANECGVPYDPDFGGEHGDEAKEQQRSDIAELKELHGVN